MKQFMTLNINNDLFRKQNLETRIKYSINKKTFHYKTNNIIEQHY